MGGCMSEDWTDKLDEESRAAWEEFVTDFRRDALLKMNSSAFVAQLVPDEDEFDVKFAVELGASIMLNKPILAIVMPGRTVPSKLRLVADRVVEADLDTEEGRKKIAEEISQMVQGLPA